MEESCKKSGFSLVEMLVAIAILGIVSAIVIAGYGKMNNQLATSNLAYDIALVFRQAQVYSSTAKATADLHGTASTGNDSYGVMLAHYYDEYNHILGDNKIVLFSESVGSQRSDSLYRCGEGGLSSLPTDLRGCESVNEYDSTYTIFGRSKIKSFCAYQGGRKYCTNFDGSKQDLKYVAVSFFGPFVSSYIKSDVFNNYDYLEITLKAIYGGYEKKVLIYKTGQISVTN